MADCPGAAGCAIPMEEDAIQPPDALGGPWQVVVRWPAADSQQGMSAEQLRAFYDKVAPEYRYSGDRFLRPAVDAGKSAPPSPLMTWWLLLYSFSILARYEPRRWSKLLDLDSSKVAAVLQYALENALTAVPHLVLEALDGEPRRHQPRPGTARPHPRRARVIPALSHPPRVTWSQLALHVPGGWCGLLRQNVMGG